MTIIQILNNFYKKKVNIWSLAKVNILKIFNFNPIFFLSLIVLVSAIFFTFSSIVNQKNKENQKNLSQVTQTNEFSNLKNYLISKINSPYEEVRYLIKNNDSIEKILKKYDIKNEDIKKISSKLKQKKLSNIYAGRELLLIFRKLENKSNTVVNLLFPISNTTSVEIRKSNESFSVKENILQLYKKEVVVRNLINNNLYSSMTKENVEPNIIVEFARIFGFEVDFQRDIRKGDWF